CRRLVERWMAKSAQGLTEVMGAWTEQQWEAEGMRPENLISRHQESCAQHLKVNPEQMFAGAINPLHELLAKPLNAAEALKIGPILQAVAELVKLLGIPEECRGQAGSAAFQEPGVIEKALAEAAAAIAEQCDHQLAVWIVRLIEDPRFRLAGAEEALRQF